MARPAVMQASPAFPLLLCINLTRAPERRLRMTEQADRLGLAIRFVDAADGADPGFDPSSGGYDAKGRSRIGPPLLKTEIACVTSHLLALRAFLASDADHAVILEDDAVLADNFAEALADLVAVHAPRSFVRLHKPRKKIFALSLATLPCGARLMLPKRVTMEATATLYDRMAAIAMIESFASYFDAFDTHRGRTWKSGLIGLEIWPPCVVTDAATPSTIDSGGGERPKGRAFSRRRPLQWPGFWLRRAADGVMELVWLAVGWRRMRLHARGNPSQSADAPLPVALPDRG